MKWLVGVTLVPGRSTLEITMKVMNRTPFAWSMLYFTNWATHVNPSYRIIFPPSSEWGSQHAKHEFIEWPIGRSLYGGTQWKGQDVSLWANHENWTSIFTLESPDDFFGGYDGEADAGTVHVADHHTTPGKKFFTFGNGTPGKAWDKILTDTDGPYLELMAGSYSDNQPDYSWIEPYETRIATEWWYPVRGLAGGFKNATVEGAVNLEVIGGGACGAPSPDAAASRDGDAGPRTAGARPHPCPSPRGRGDSGAGRGPRAWVSFSVTREIRGATAVVKCGEKVLFEKRIDISPAAPFAAEVAIPEGRSEYDVRAALYDDKGREVIAYQPRPRRNEPRPTAVVPPAAPKDMKTNEDLYIAAQRLEQFHSPALEPGPYYEEGLRREGDDYRINTAVGLMHLKRMRLEDAERHLTAAVERVSANHTRPRDGEALYYLGVARRLSGKREEARDAFNRAAWCFGWRAAAHMQLGEMAFEDGDIAGALASVEHSLAHNAWNTKALCLKSALLRVAGRPAEALEACAKALEIDPLDFLAANGRALAMRALGDEGAEGAFAQLEENMRGEMQSYLELAWDYAGWGRLR